MHRSNIICPIPEACTAVHCYLDGAGFILKITLVCENVGVDRCVYPILSPCLRGTATKLQGVKP